MSEHEYQFYIWQLYPVRQHGSVLSTGGNEAIEGIASMILHGRDDATVAWSGTSEVDWNDPGEILMVSIEEHDGNLRKFQTDSDGKVVEIT